jgi:hypothetical protein
MLRFRTVLFGATLSLPLLGGCRSAAVAYGADVRSARANFEAFIAGFEARFTNVVRHPKVQYGRLRIARYALAPSKLAADTAIWTTLRTSRTGPVREAEWQAAMAGNQFTFVPRADGAHPARVGEQRHLIALSQRAPNAWYWHTVVEHHVGTVPPARANDIAQAFFAGAERPGTAMRVDYRKAFPRTTTALGRLLSVDSIIATSQLDGSTLVSMQIRLDARNIAAAGFPAYARFLQKYVEAARYHLRLADRYGNDYFDANAVNRVLTLRFRTRRGELQPIAGQARPIPDTLRFAMDASIKYGLFTIGFSNLTGDFVHAESPQENAWQLRFTREPTWHLPLMAERLLSAAIRYPFEGTGVYVQLGLRLGPSGQTLSERVVDVAVKESAIMRWLGNLGFGAMTDFAGTVEEEENRFLVELLQAMKADMESLAPFP